MDSGLALFGLFGNKFFDLFQTEQDEYLEKSEKDFVRTFDLPGIKKSDVEMKTTSNVVSFKAQNKNTQRYYSYSFYVPQKYFDISKIKAKLEDGVLTIYAPRKNIQEQSHNIVQIE